MTTLADILLYLVLIGTPIAIGGAAIYGIHSVVGKIHRINARIIWCRICKHRQPYPHPGMKEAASRLASEKRRK